MERPLVIEHRDALVYMLTEAAELEHAICCQYLFAAFGMKTGTNEGLTDRQLEAVARWRRTILGIATEEMMHLALVNNLLVSLGAAPRVGRPNFPQAGRYYPPGVQLALVPFGERALRHFLYLERPEGINLQDAEGFEIVDESEPLMTEQDIVPRPQDFATVGHLYRSIEDGFRNLAERHGEEWLFVGPRRAQATPELFQWPELVPVTDLASAVQALETIVEQGEGPRGHWKDAHYGRLLVALGEFLTMKREHPSFEPTRPVVPAFVRRSLDSETPALVSDPITARALDAFNVSYEILLYVLARFFGQTSETDEQLKTLADVAVGLMVSVIEPLGKVVTRLPVGPDHPGATAGPAFELFYRSGYMLPDTRSAWVVMHERMLELGAFLEGSINRSEALAPLRDIAPAVAKLADRMAEPFPQLGHRSLRTPPSWMGAVEGEAST